MRAPLIVVHDGALVMVTLWLALVLRLGIVELPDYYDRLLLVAAPLTAALAIPVFYGFGLHRPTWRHASLPDLVTIIKAVTVTVLMLILFVAVGSIDLPRSVPLIQWCLLVLGLGGSRMAWRWLHDHWRQRRLLHGGTGPAPVLLLGSGPETQLFLRAVAAGHAGALRVVGILDDGDALLGRSLHGVPVLGRCRDLLAVLEALERRGDRPQRLIMTSSGQQRVAELSAALERAQRLGITLARLPGLTEVEDADADRWVGIEPIAVEDLLSRPQTVLDRAALSGLIAGRRVLVTGAAGSIGSELARQIAKLAPARLALVDHSEFGLYQIDRELRERGAEPESVLCNVRDQGRVDRLFGHFRPEIVFHAAALKHVPLAEAHPAEAVLTNVLGTRCVADAACAHGAIAAILISTDKAVRPSSVMGASKRMAEHYCQALDVATAPANSAGTRFMTVRFGNVLGSSGSVVPLFQDQLAHGGPLTVTHPDVERYFMTIGEAVELILQASAHGIQRGVERGRVLVLDMGQPVKIVELAKQVIRLAGLEPGRDIGITFTGLRPGEKLHEELFDGREELEASQMKGILVARPSLIELPILRVRIDQLTRAARQDEVGTLRRLLGLQDSDPQPKVTAHA